MSGVPGFESRAYLSSSLSEALLLGSLGGVTHSSSR